MADKRYIYACMADKTTHQEYVAKFGVYSILYLKKCLILPKVIQMRDYSEENYRTQCLARRRSVRIL